MKKLRYILFPLSILYGLIVDIRNRCYDFDICKATAFTAPIIVVGNLNTGGTGKTPFVEYLVRLLKHRFKIAILSRGYKRKSKEFYLATDKTTVDLIGDEPMQYHLKFKSIQVAVDANRVQGVAKLLKFKKKPDVILLDDAYQHRKIKAGLNILLTSYNDLYVDDYMLPTGNLREKAKNAKRSSHIIVTKCPIDLSEKAKNEIRLKLKLKAYQKLYFSAIIYKKEVVNAFTKITLNDLKKIKVLLVTGIANPTPLRVFFKDNNIDFKHLIFRDHHNFTKKDKLFIAKKAQKLNANKTVIVTTEKDYVRSFMDNKNVFYLPIEIVLLQDEKKICKEILDYVGKGPRNS